MSPPQDLFVLSTFSFSSFTPDSEDTSLLFCQRISDKIFTQLTPPKPWSEVLVAQSCPGLCDTMDFSPPGSSIHRIFQARILEWVAIPSSKGSSQPRDQTQVSTLQADSLPLSHQGSPSKPCLPRTWISSSPLVSYFLSLNSLKSPHLKTNNSCFNPVVLNDSYF